MGTYLRLVFTMFFWGGTFIAGRLLGETMNPLSAACGRFVLASFFLMAVLKFRKEKLPSLNRRQWFGLVLTGLTGIFSYNLFFFAGLQHVEAGRAAMIIAGNPVVTTLLAILLLGERFNLVKIGGIFLSISGALTVISKGEFRHLIIGGGGVGIGELYLICCVFSWAAYALIGRKLLAHISPLVAVTYSCLIGTAFLLLTALLRGVPLHQELLHPNNILNLLYLAIFGTGIGFTWFYEGVQKLGAGRASLFVNLVPVSGVTLGILLLGERPDSSLFVGGTLVLAGLILINFDHLFANKKSLRAPEESKKY